MANVNALLIPVKYIKKKTRPASNWINETKGYVTQESEKETKQENDYTDIMICYITNAMQLMMSPKFGCRDSYTFLMKVTPLLQTAKIWFSQKAICQKK